MLTTGFQSAFKASHLNLFQAIQQFACESGKSAFFTTFRHSNLNLALPTPTWYKLI